MGKKIVGLKVIKPGSSPDVDSDFGTKIRDNVIEHVTDLYGKDNVANIITYNTLAAKGAFKEMCTIYEIPPEKANKISALVPKPIEGKDIKLSEIFDPTHERYDEGADFRAAVADDYWKKIIEGAIQIEGRSKSVGMHPCFVEDTLVYTNYGYKKINKIKEGDLVLTHKDRFQKVVELQKNESSDIYRLETNNSTPVKATGNHPFYVKSYGKKAKWKELSKISKKDYVGIPLNNLSIIPKLRYDLPFKNPKFWEIAGNLYGGNHITNIKLYHSLNCVELNNFFITTVYEEITSDVFNEDILNLPVKHLKYFLKGFLTSDNSFEVADKHTFLAVLAMINKVYKKECSKIVIKRKNGKTSYKGFFNVHKKSKSFCEDGFLWVPVKKISKIKKHKTVTVYNLSVIEDNSYIVENLTVHNCGIIMSNKPLHDVLPLYVRQEDGRVLTQWTYGACEELGLIKMDFLGLDTVDVIQNTLVNIMKNGKTPPNMLDFIHGPMDDKKTFDLIRSGKTMGIFQFSSKGMQELLIRMQAREFDDLVAANALYRPGPMASNTHIMYADRRAGREKATQTINPEFTGTVLEEILKKTQNLIIFQEQIQQISNKIAGMTLQEGDELRSAMGKKKKEKMDKMKPIFIAGGIKNGFSEKAMNDLWNTMEPFAKYAFNKSHSVAYSLAAIQFAYLKANYPVEFMAALISQNVDNKDKILNYLKEAREMKIKIATVDVNKSDIEISPNYKKKLPEEADILYGFSGVANLSSSTAAEILKEREENGLFASVQDFIVRCQNKNIGNKRVYINLALAGAFDSFGVSRRSVVSNIQALISVGKTKMAKGNSLFEMFSTEDNDDSLEVDLSNVEEYPWAEKLRLEADTIGLFLSGHPLQNLGTGLSNLANTTISKILSTNENITATLPVTITDLDKKSTRRGKYIQVTLDDGTGYLKARLSPAIVKGIDKTEAMKKIKRLYINGETNVPSNYPRLLSDPKIVPYDNVKKNFVYLVNITYRKGSDDFPYSVRVNSIRPLTLAKNGMLPIRLRLDESVIGKNVANKMEKALAKNLNDKRPGDYPIYMTRYKKLPTPEIVDTHILAAIEEMQNGDGAGSKRHWPPKSDITFNKEILPEYVKENQIYAIDTLDYEDTGYTASKTVQTKQAIEKFLGDEGYDFGAFDETLLFD